MLYAKITKSGGNYGYVTTLDDLENTFQSELEAVQEWAEEGDEINIEFIEMSEEEYLNLEEFAGW